MLYDIFGLHTRSFVYRINLTLYLASYAGETRYFCKEFLLYVCTHMVSISFFFILVFELSILVYKVYYYVD